MRWGIKMGVFTTHSDGKMRIKSETQFNSTKAVTVLVRASGLNAYADVRI